MILDNICHIETPEGVEIVLQPAGIPARGAALIVDELIRWGIILLLSLVFGLLGQFGLGLFLLCLFAVTWFYGVAFEVLNHGQTPGKRMLGLAVVHADGTPVRLPASLIRNLLLVVDMLPAFYVAGMLSMVLTRRFCRLGDTVSGTQVVYRQRGFRPAVPDVDGRATLPVVLTADEQQAVLAYAERLSQLSPGRAVELANVLTPLLGRQDEAAREHLLQVANGLRSSR